MESRLRNRLQVLAAAEFEPVPAALRVTLFWEYMHTFTYCPTEPQRVFFDEHIGLRKHMPVHAHSIGGGGFESNGISFEDYSRMRSPMLMKPFSGRRTVVPLWAINNSDLQVVLVSYLEQRAGYKINIHGTGTLLERLQQAEQRLIAQTSSTERRLDALCGKYVELQRNRGTREELKALRRTINCLDTQLIVNRAPARIAAAVVYKFFREGLKSTQIANDLGLHSPGVRQMLFRLQRTARALGYPEPEKITAYRTELALAHRRERVRRHTKPEQCQSEK